MTATQDATTLAALRRGDESAFNALVERHHSSMVWVAKAFVPSRAVAEEVAQEAWLGVLKGLDRFEGRSSLRTWIFRIVVNVAKTRGQRESRSVPFSSLDDAPGEPSVDPDRFHPPGHPHAQAWSNPPKDWEGTPEQRALSSEVRTVISAAIEGLAPNQRSVIVLRDVEGWDPEEVCNVLGITETNQRVLLHRARSKVRRALEQYYDEERG